MEQMTWLIVGVCTFLFVVVPLIWFLVWLNTPDPQPSQVPIDITKIWNPFDSGSLSKFSYKSVREDANYFTYYEVDSALNILEDKIRELDRAYYKFNYHLNNNRMIREMAIEREEIGRDLVNLYNIRAYLKEVASITWDKENKNRRRYY